jgi:cytochrome c oxidase subunit 1
MSTATLEPRVHTQRNYLNADYGWKSWLFTVDHKRIALLYMISVTFFFIIGGSFAVLMRIHLTEPQGALVQPETYNKLFTLHGVVMIFFFLIPSIPAVLGNFLVPLMVGARDLAFPKLNLLSWYIYITGGLFTLYSAIAGGVDTGWTFYTALQQHLLEHAGHGCGRRSLHHRIFLDPHGPEFHRHHSQDARPGPHLVPHAALPVGHVRNEHHYGARDARAGDHAFSSRARASVPRGHIQPGAWRRSVALPASVLVLFAPGRLHHDFAGHGSGQRDHRLLCEETHFWLQGVCFSSVAIAVLGFLVWGHHMFVTGQSIYAGLIFSLLSFLVAIPSAIKVFNWTATLYKGSISYEAPMLYALGFIGLFTMGGLTGLFLASLATDVHLNGTYFIVAHFHYIMVGGAVMGYLGGIHFWWPKITGRMYPNAWAALAAAIVFVGFNLTFFPQFILGYLGMPRRYAFYPAEFQVLNVMSSAGATVLGVGYLIPLIYLMWSMRYGPLAEPNPWGATGLEWTTSSPPPTENFAEIPVVTQEAYAYAPEEAAGD